MPHYEVTFFKYVLSSDGHPFKAPQAAISVWADNIKEAERQAMNRFACLRGIPNWNLHADTFEGRHTRHDICRHSVKRRDNGIAVRHSRQAH